MDGVTKRFNVHSNANLGSMEIALAISLVLFGVLMIQAYNYYQNFDDRLFLKTLVTVISVPHLHDNSYNILPHGHPGWTC